VSLADRVPSYLSGADRDLVIFACGDPAHAEHDSIAIAACTTLPPEILARADVKLVGPMRPEYLRDLPSGTRVIIADTVAGIEGEVSLIPFLGLSGREDPLQASSTPDQPIDELVAMAQLLRAAPLRGLLVGLGVAEVDLRAKPPTEAVDTMRAAVVQATEELDAA
jgi:hypothetical protein